MNRNYQRGRAFEYRICQSLKKQGYEIVQRSAGSHSVVDIWAIDVKNKKIKLVQAKSGKSKVRELSKLSDFTELGGYYLVEAVAV